MSSLYNTLKKGRAYPNCAGWLQHLLVDERTSVGSDMSWGIRTEAIPAQ